MATDIEARLVRIECKLTQLMMHVGLDPYERTYGTPAPIKYTGDAELDPSCAVEGGFAQREG